MIGLFHNDVLEYYEAIDKKEGLLFKYVEFARKQEKELALANKRIEELERNIGILQEELLESVGVIFARLKK